MEKFDTDIEPTGSDFERKVNELQQIVDKLESDVSLEDGMKLFEDGLKITKECIDALNDTRERIAGLKKQLDIIMEQPIFGGDDE